MTIREKMLERRQQARERIKEELQREVAKVEHFAEELQKKHPAQKEFSCKVYESGSFCLLVESEIEGENAPKVCLNLCSQIEMDPQDFREFLEERLQEEGVELGKEELKISLL